MSLTDVERALIERALDRLAQGDEHAHKISLIERIAGKAAADEVRALRKDYKEANDAAKEHGGAMLSAEAADYWQEARGVLAYGAMVMANPSRGRELALSRKCEHLLASFEQRVPAIEHGKFRQYRDGDGANWDDRWHNTIDGFFPLLESHYSGSVPISDPMAEAQRTILGGLLSGPSPAANVNRLSGVLRSIAAERNAEEAKLREKLARQKRADANSEKNARKKAAAARHQAKVDAGDQQATRARRARKMKPVDALFSGLSKGR